MDRKQTFRITAILCSIALVAGLLQFRPLPIALVYSIVAVAVTWAALENLFFEHDHIRDHFTLPGIALGIVASGFFPMLQHQATWWQGATTSAICALGTFGLLLAFVNLYQRLSGPRIVRFDAPVRFRWTLFPNAADSTATFELGDELFAWTSFFARETDELRIECEQATIDSTPIGAVEMVFRYDRLFIGGRRYSLTDISTIRGNTTNLSLPKEAFGFGVVKAMSAFTALFGWRGALFTLAVASILGMFGVPLVLRSRTTGGLPFMPFLSVAALIWMFYGPELVSLYLDFAHRK